MPGYGLEYLQGMIGGGAAGVALYVLPVAAKASKMESDWYPTRRKVLWNVVTLLILTALGGVAALIAPSRDLVTSIEYGVGGQALVKAFAGTVAEATA